MLAIFKNAPNRPLRYLSYKLHKFAMEETKAELKPNVSQEKMMKAIVLTGPREF